MAKNPNDSKIWQCLADNYINRPYLDIPSVIANHSYNLQHNNYTVYHRNHDVTHAVRQRHYAQNYLEIIAKYGTDKFSALAKDIANDAGTKTCLELAIFYVAVAEPMKNQVETIQVMLSALQNYLLRLQPS
nr:SidE phosphodiesterase domain-containing protein [Legionella tunisiensis]